jgi:CRISPR-associated protein Cas1
LRKLLNTLYVSSQGTYLRKEGETVVVEKEKQRVLQLPIHTIGGIVCFGNVSCSPFLLGFCAERNVVVSFLSKHGRFLAAIHGPVSGNVLVRRQQYRMADNEKVSGEIAANIVIGKLANCRVVINRIVRDHGAKINSDILKGASKNIDRIMDRIPKALNIDEIRGFEGQAAAEYFRVFNHFIIEQKNDFIFTERNRRPPLDEVNAMLSFVYTLLAHDIRSALETVCLDPAVGFLHRDRPGRPGLALDIMEEFRPLIADRLVLSLINRRQIGKNDFSKAANGAVTMDDAARKTILTEYQKRKQDSVLHPFIKETVPIGLLFFIQANLMARYIRGDIDGYPPFFWR